MSRVVVTGAAGFIGSNIIAGLNARGIEDIIATVTATIDARASEIIDAGDVSSVTVYHPSGFVAWYYEAPSLTAIDGRWTLASLYR